MLRLIAHVAFRHGQELGSVLDDSKSFDLLLIMRGTNVFVMRVALVMMLHSMVWLGTTSQLNPTVQNIVLIRSQIPAKSGHVLFYASGLTIRSTVSIAEVTSQL